MKQIVIVLAMVCCGCATTDAPANRTEFAWAEAMRPLWRGTTVAGEGMLFVKDGATPPMARLLFEPRGDVRLVRPSTGEIYSEGKDFVVDRAARTVSLTEHSGVPFILKEEQYPPFESAKYHHRDGKRGLFWGEGRVYHDLQVEAAYSHRRNAWRDTGADIPQPKIALLPRTSAALREGKPLSIVLLGDSISAGGNASGAIGAPPHMPPFGELVAQALHARFGSGIAFKNHAVGGKATPWGIEICETIAPDRPGLMIIAFGMNDASGKLSPADYRANTARQMAIMREANPDIEFILVATMEANAEWSYAAPELYPQYRDELLALEGPGVAVADVTTVWEAIVLRKKFLDLTGNGLNHPNDFGHRIYTATILSVLGAD